MKDTFGQERTPVQVREGIVAALFVVIVGVGVWSVALPALDEHHEDDPTNAEPATSTNEEPSSPVAPAP